MRVSIVDIEGDAASVDERGASVEAQEAANLQLYEQALLQHATNPVEWFPWGEEAFARDGS